MEIIHKADTYMSGSGKVVFKREYDYCLFRQDMGGTESVYFNHDEIEDIFQKIEDGEILIHNNYSIVFCKDQDDLTQLEECFGCYATIFEESI